MTVENTNPIQQFTANGETTVFAINFEVEGKDNIKVTANEETVLINDYSYDDSVNAVVFNTAPIDGSSIVIERVTRLERSINYQTYDNSFRPETLNNDLDRIWRVTQELNLKDTKLDEKIHKFRDDVNLTSLENTLKQAEEIRDDTAISLIEVQNNVSQSQSLLANTVIQADSASTSANNAETSKNQAEIAASTAILQTNSIKGYVDNALTSFTNGALKVYPTLALANADIVNISTDTKIEVLSEENGGAYFKQSSNATVLTKSPYDPYLHVKNTLESYPTVKASILTNQDLFNLSDDGVYIRPYSTGITEEMNYPKELAGVLTRFSNKQTGSNRRVFLTYQVFNTNKKYTATLVNNVWGQWLEDIDAQALDSTLTSYRKITRYTNGTSRNLNTFEEDGIFYFEGNTATSAVINKPENSPFSLQVERINNSGLTIIQTVYTKTANIYFRVGIRSVAGADLVFPETWTKLNRSETSVTVSPKDSSGVLQIGVLTPTVITALGYLSYSDITTSGIYYVTSTTSAEALGLPGGRAGRLIVTYEGTTSGSKTGVMEYIPLGKKGIYISRREAGSNSSWSDWSYLPSKEEVEALITASQTDSIDKSVGNAVIGIGSSSMDRWGAQLTLQCNNRKRSYINAGFSGTTAATGAMYCGHANYYLNFEVDTVLQNGVATAFTFSNDGFGTSTSNPGLDNRGWKVTLENGVRGQLNGYARTFVPENLTEDLTVSGPIKINSDYARYKRAINIVNTGKNNMSDTAYDVIIESFDETIRQIRLVQGNDDRFVVVGHFANRDYSSTRVTVIDNINAYLKNKYGNRYIDSKAWLCSSKVWTDLGIIPTQEDLDLQATGNIPRSLSSDGIHMNTSVGNYFVSNFIIPKLVALNYI